MAQMAEKSSSLEKSESQDRSDLVAYWSVPLLDGVHTVEFEHGTTSGKRVLRVDGNHSTEEQLEPAVKQNKLDEFSNGPSDSISILDIPILEVFRSFAMYYMHFYEIFRKEWMFKLVGDEEFSLGKQEAKCLLRVDPMPHFAFSYSLLVDGKPLRKFTEKQSQSIRSWAVITDGQRYRIVFEKQTLNIYVNGELVEAENSFVANGTEMSFEMGTTSAIIRAETTQKKEGVVHQLFVDGKCIEEDIIF